MSDTGFFVTWSLALWRSIVSPHETSSFKLYKYINIQNYACRVFIGLSLIVWYSMTFAESLLFYPPLSFCLPPGLISKEHLFPHFSVRVTHTVLSPTWTPFSAHLRWFLLAFLLLQGMYSHLETWSWAPPIRKRIQCLSLWIWAASLTVTFSAQISATCMISCFFTAE